MSRLKHLLRLRYGDALAATEREDGDVPVFGSNGPIGTHSASNTKAPVILVGRKGSFGKVVWSDVAGFCIDTAYFVDESSCKGELRFAFYALQSLGLDTLSRDTGVPGLSREDAHDRRLRLPDPENQLAIASYLDRETDLIDGLIEKKARFIALLKEKRAAVITHAVTKGFDTDAPTKDSGEAWIGEIPVHWEVKPLRAFFSFRNEKNDPVKTENILSLSIAHGVTPYTEEGRGGNKSKDDLTAYKIAHEGDIVLNSMNVIVGAVGRSKYYGAISPVYYALYPKNDDVYVPFFEKIFMNSGFQKGLLRFGKGILMKISGTGQMNTIRMKISQDDLRTVRFPVPPHEEQVEIARQIEHEVSRIDGLIAKTEHSIDLLREKRSALITAAVTGKIDVRRAA